MAIDVRQLIEKAVRLISENGDLLQMFQKEPVKAIEKATGLDLPDELAEKVVAGVKAGLKLDSLSGVADKLKKLFPWHAIYRHHNLLHRQLLTDPHILAGIIWGNIHDRCKLSSQPVHKLLLCCHRICNNIPGGLQQLSAFLILRYIIPLPVKGQDIPPSG